MKYEEVMKLLTTVDIFAREHDSYEYGLPLGCGVDDAFVRIVCEQLNITLDEDPRIASIVSFTGCSRKVAQDLINSGEI